MVSCCLDFHNIKLSRVGSRITSFMNYVSENFNKYFYAVSSLVLKPYSMSDNQKWKSWQNFHWCSFNMGYLDFLTLVSLYNANDMVYSNEYVKTRSRAKNNKYIIIINNVSISSLVTVEVTLHVVQLAWSMIFRNICLKYHYWRYISIILPLNAILFG